jgi:antitoxin component HigA of HigAB toxin-antitoxin module
MFQAEEGTAQADERDVLVTLIQAYENRHYDFGPADPVEAIKFRIARRDAREDLTVEGSSGVDGGCALTCRVRAAAS